MSLKSDNIQSKDEGVALSMNPKKFIVWLFIVSIVMIFVSLTSAYIVRQAEGNWKEFELPTIFLYSTLVLLLSSVTLHLGYLYAKKDEFLMLKLAVVLTFILGISFLFMQLEGWNELVQNKIYFSFSNPSEAFLYVLTGLHAFHLITGLVFLIIVLISTFKLNIHAKNLAQYEMCATYWHFLDGLWLFLYLFLMFNK